MAEVNRFDFQSQMVRWMTEYSFSKIAFDTLSDGVFASDNCSDLRAFLKKWNNYNLLTLIERARLQAEPNFQFYRDFMNGI